MAVKTCVPWQFHHGAHARHTVSIYQQDALASLLKWRIWIHSLSYSKPSIRCKSLIQLCIGFRGLCMGFRRTLASHKPYLAHSNACSLHHSSATNENQGREG